MPVLRAWMAAARGVVSGDGSGRDRRAGATGDKRASLLLVGVAVIATGSAAMGAATPPPRPLVFVPAALTQQAQKPCALYVCPSNIKVATSWQRTVGALPSDYCKQYKCRPMDLISVHGVDDNLFPLNPEWAYSVENGSVPNADQLCGGFTSVPPACTSQPVTLDSPGTGTAAYFACPAGRSPYLSFHGHINYEPATYQGYLRWDSLSPRVLGVYGTDDDYSLNLQTADGAGTAKGNLPYNVHLEFDSDETIDHFDSSLWWKLFHQNVDAGRGRVINGDYAVVTGLAGLDTAHTTATELHPVYAIAIEDMRQYAQVYGEDEWAIFARNWGNEGYCSQRRHPLPPGPLTIRIPWFYRGTGVFAKPATGVQILSVNDFYTNIENGTATLSILPRQGILLRFDLSTPPADEPLFWGTIALQWTFTSTPPPKKTSPPGATAPQAAQPVGGSENGDVERQVADLFTRLAPAMKAKAAAKLRRPTAPAISRRAAIEVVSPPRSPLRRNQAAPVPIPDPVQIRRGRIERQVLCTAYRQKVPHYPNLCR